MHRTIELLNEVDFAVFSNSLMPFAGENGLIELPEIGESYHTLAIAVGNNSHDFWISGFSVTP